MQPPVQVMFVVIVGALSALYAFFLEVRRGIEEGRLLEWLKTERTADWDALTRSDRFLTMRAVEILRRGPLASDADFHANYQMTRHGTRFAVAMTIAVTAIALLVLGTLFFDWDW